MKLVYLEWVDSCSPTDNGWLGVRRSKREQPLVCKSIGWVVNENSKVITISGHLSFGADDGGINLVCGEMTIPKVAIIKRRKVKV